MQGSPRIIINGRWLSKPQTGTGRYSTEMLRMLLQLPRSERIEIWIPRDAVLPNWVEGICTRRFRCNGQMFEQLVLPVRSVGSWVISMAGPAPLLKKLQVAVMHDATPFRLPETYTKRFGAWYRLMYRVLARRARVPVTVSRFSAVELAEVTRVDPSRFLIASPAATRLPPPRKPDVELPDRFLLMVGTLAPHKNFGPTASVLLEAGYPLVIVGDLSPAAAFGTAELPVSERVVRVGRVSDSELAWLYAAAEALVFPSLYEGFGLPVLEAQQCGCPVVSSDRASLVEVLAGSAEFFDPADSAALLRATAAVWGSPRRRDQLRELGMLNVARYEWARSAGLMLEAVRSSDRSRQSAMSHGGR